MLKASIAVAGIAVGATAAVAVDKPVYDVAYEIERGAHSEGDLDRSEGYGLNNDFFEVRETHIVNDDTCFYLSGKLRNNYDAGRYPDTYLFMFDKDDNVVCEDNDSSSKGNGKASACYGVAPIPNGDDPNATIRLGITGRPDGVDNMFNGLFFNAPHGQLGEAEVCINYYNDGGGLIDSDTYLCTFVTGAEAFRVNYVVPAGTASVDVEIDNTTEVFPIANDVDFYELQGLEAACDYAITVIGGMDADCEPNCAILGWYDKNGGLVNPLPNNGNYDSHPNAQLSVISDANGRVRFAVTGYGDHDFDGILDETQSRNVETPGYNPPPVHGCNTCYTLKLEWNKHVDVEPCEGEGGGEMLLQLTNGDLNLDGGVDVVDLAIMLNNWGWRAGL